MFSDLYLLIIGGFLACLLIWAQWSIHAKPSLRSTLWVALALSGLVLLIPAYALSARTTLEIGVAFYVLYGGFAAACLLIVQKHASKDRRPVVQAVVILAVAALLIVCMVSPLVLLDPT